MEQKNFEYTEEAKYNNTMSMNASCSCPSMSNQMMCPPIEECPQERVCHRYMCYEVPHIMPCNTRIINHQLTTTKLILL